MVYVFLANGFEETEAIAPIDMLRRARLDVITVGIGGKEVTSSHGIPMKADITDGEIELSDNLEMIVLPGGSLGTENLDKSPVVQSAVDYCAKNNIPMGAICAAPSIYGKRGLLKGLKATAFPDYRKYLEGAEISERNVVTDGLFTTAAGAGVSVDFGLELVKVLKGQQLSDEIRSTIQCAR
ncbi:MAG: DJ-1/PfpI family protein [Oscillospiraceae bacterium]|nr:DJ-1/PfpI family protein [Oscillospiraceae bacterium]